jgi:hypothetical protein
MSTVKGTHQAFPLIPPLTRSAASFKQDDHKLLLIPGPVEISDAGESRWALGGYTGGGGLPRGNLWSTPWSWGFLGRMLEQGS